MLGHILVNVTWATFTLAAWAIRGKAPLVFCGALPLFMRRFCAAFWPIAGRFEPQIMGGAFWEL